MPKHHSPGRSLRSDAPSGGSLPPCGRFDLLKVDRLEPDSSNPRRHGREQVAAIARSIETFGFTAPILIDGKNRIVAGHGRLEAAKRLRLETVPVIRLEHLTEAQAKAYMLADNKLTDRSSWDDTKVAIVLKELSEIALDFEIESTGFEAPEIDFRIQSLEEPDAADDADDFDAPSGGPVSGPGDLWLLNGHRLLCGDALDPGSYEALLGGEKAAGIFTDAPYNVRIKGHAVGKGRTKHRKFPMASGEMTGEEFARFLGDAFALMVQHAANSATFFACMDWRHVFEIAGTIRSLDCDTNASENDIRAFVTKRKVSGGTVSDKGRDARDIMLGLAKTCMKLKLSFYEFVGARLGIPGPKSHPSQASSGQPPHKSKLARPGICPGYLLICLRRVVLFAQAEKSAVRSSSRR
jgi:ParB-like nuclease domain